MQGLPHNPSKKREILLLLGRTTRPLLPAPTAAGIAKCCACVPDAHIHTEITAVPSLVPVAITAPSKCRRLPDAPQVLLSQLALEVLHKGVAQLNLDDIHI